MRTGLGFCLALAVPGLCAQEAVVTLRSTVTGNQEQPRVMYILPWQRPGDTRFDYALDTGIGDELFAPIDRDVFVRGLDYQEKMAARRPGTDPVRDQ